MHDQLSMMRKLKLDQSEWLYMHLSQLLVETGTLHDWTDIYPSTGWKLKTGHDSSSSGSVSMECPRREMSRCVWSSLWVVCKITQPCISIFSVALHPSILTPSA